VPLTHDNKHWWALQGLLARGLSNQSQFNDIMLDVEDVTSVK